MRITNLKKEISIGVKNLPEVSITLEISALVDGTVTRFQYETSGYEWDAYKEEILKEVESKFLRHCLEKTINTKNWVLNETRRKNS